MEWAYNIGGSTPHIKKYRIDGGTTVLQGVPVASSIAADADGVIVVTTAAAIACLGITTDTATGTNAQATTGDNAGFVSVVINPDAVYRCKLNAGATEDTALDLKTATSASADGLLIPTVTDEYVVWGYDGANVGHVRKASGATAVVQAFPFDIAIGDRFLSCQPEIGDYTQFPVLTTLVTQCDATATASDTGNDNFLPVELHLRTNADDGQNNSFVLFHAVSHAFGSPALVQ